uniref:Uncharacterized protein n=1 Tax=Sinocyclocheilus rhinocerous TaxID=307959 RepID=A0A673GHN8_9TELE
MAKQKASISWAEDQFSCSVCLDLLKEPVTIPCGHSYCKGCITDCWNQEDQRGIYRCPQCRQTFTPRPVLSKNVVFAEMVEKLKNTRLQSAPCDSCTGIKQKAVKSCLECRSSYCQNHLEQHESLFRSKGHNLMDATGQLQEMICPRHNKMLEIYCWTDKKCICMLCLVDEHKNHDTESTAAARQEIQVLLHTGSHDSQGHFSPHLAYDFSLNQENRSAESRAEKQLERLEQRIDNMKRTDTELKQLFETQDHIQFFQVTKIFSYTEMRTSTDLSIDRELIFLYLSLITVTDTHQCYPDHPDRFNIWMEALCRESVTGCCYWEVEWSSDIDIAVTYKSISRKGNGPECVAGFNNQSWSLYCSADCCAFCHNKIETVLPVTSVSNRIGVYVNHSTGILSFYSVSNTMSLIHRVQTTFTQPLYAVFGFNRHSTVKLCHLMY